MNKQLISILSAIVLIALGFWGFAQLKDDEKNDDDNKSNSSMEKKDDKMMKKDEDDKMMKKESDKAVMEKEATNPLAAVVGTKQGTATLLLNSLVFPTATMVTNPDQSFTLEAEGLDLALLGNTALQVQGVYPKVMVKTGGKVVVSANGAELVLNNLTPGFYVTDAAGVKTPLDATVQASLAQGLAAAGIAIPTIDSTKPVTVPVTIDVATTGMFTVKSTSTSPILAQFVSK
jgi:predicted small lipoprotein YifL